MADYQNQKAAKVKPEDIAPPILDMEIANEIARKKNLIKLIPDKTIIEPKLLGSLTNDEFVQAFKSYQKLMIEIYSEVETDPYKYGFSLTPSQTFSYTFYNRLSDFTFSMCSCGKYQNGMIRVDMIEFKHMMRKHKKLNILVDLLTSYGFTFDSFNSKSSSFTVSYTDDPNLLYVIYRDAEIRNEHNAFSGYLQHVGVYVSYRWIESTASQIHEKSFLFRMDTSSEEFRKLQYWLYDEAKRYGYIVHDRQVIGPHNSVLYQKSKKDFMYLCENVNDTKSQIFVKMILRSGLNESLFNRFPEVFEDEWAKCTSCNNSDKCSCHINFEYNGKKLTNCAHKSFYFRNITLDDMPLLLDTFLLENKIVR